MTAKGKTNFGAIIPMFKVRPEIRKVLEAEAESEGHPWSTSLADICREAISEYIFNHKLFVKHNIAPPAWAPKKPDTTP